MQRSFFGGSVVGTLRIVDRCAKMFAVADICRCVLRAFLFVTTTSITLLQRVRDRQDQAAWERFVSLYTPLLMRWAGRAGLAQQDAVDLVQDLFATLLIEMPRFEYDPARGLFRAWLKTLTMNQCRKQQRKRLVAEGRGGDDDLLPMYPDNDVWEALWNQE